ncbi:hypothetical protein [Aidingimonas halophila]|uniref:hypothetical protein n=1 Tax=Aidingimonas halophila TaxID=574349 RepID=UPI0035716FDA
MNTNNWYYFGPDGIAMQSTPVHPLILNPLTVTTRVALHPEESRGHPPQMFVCDHS